MNGTLKAILILFAAVLTGGLLFSVPVFSHGPGYGGSGYWDCPMRQGGYSHGHHMGFQGSGHHMGQTSVGQPVAKDEANYILKQYVRNTNNPNLKLGDISDEKGFYEASILTKDGSLVDKIRVDKQTGWLSSAYSE